jgi:hypothetical protein
VRFGAPFFMGRYVQRLRLILFYAISSLPDDLSRASMLRILLLNLSALIGCCGYDNQMPPLAHSALQ